MSNLFLSIDSWGDKLLPFTCWMTSWTSPRHYPNSQRMRVLIKPCRHFALPRRVISIILMWNYRGKFLRRVITGRLLLRGWGGEADSEPLLSSAWRVLIGWRTDGMCRLSANQQPPRVGSYFPHEVWALQNRGSFEAAISACLPSPDFKLLP